MGLDFSLYKKRKDISIEDFFNSADDKDELAYGRKSWELVYKLATNEDINNCCGILTSERWEDLMVAIDPIGDLLENIFIAYDHYDFYMDHYEDENKDIIDKGSLIFTEEDKKLIAQYEYWYDKTFDNSPVLGYHFSVSYMKNFYDAKEKVRDVLKDPDYEVAMIISY